MSFWSVYLQYERGTRSSKGLEWIWRTDVSLLKRNKKLKISFFFILFLLSLIDKFHLRTNNYLIMFLKKSLYWCSGRCWWRPDPILWEMNAGSSHYLSCVCIASARGRTRGRLHVVCLSVCIYSNVRCMFQAFSLDLAHFLGGYTLSEDSKPAFFGTWVQISVAPLIFHHRLN